MTWRAQAMFADPYQYSGPPTDFSGCVDSITSKSVNPNVDSTSSMRSSTPLQEGQ
jgi:hypothetical protein